jgi:CRISPR-associated protein Cas1
MSHHLLHIFSHGAFLSKERGQLLMRAPGEESERQMPLEDILGVIIAARGVSLSNDLIRALAERQAVLLHCDSSYRPIALTAPLARTTRPNVVENQANRSLELHQRLWRRIVRNKVRNQMRNLKLAGELSPELWAEIQRPGFRPQESLWARRYWKGFFPLAGGAPGEGRDQQSGTPLNGMLNYGYAVLQAVVHRSIVVNGLLPNLGFHHATKYSGDPLVYDLMEPFRAFVDGMLLAFRKTNEPTEESFPLWARHVAAELIRLKVKTPHHGRQRLLHAIDQWVKMIAGCLNEKSVSPYWEVTLDQKSLQDGLGDGDV